MSIIYLLTVNQVPDDVVRQTFGAPTPQNAVYFQFLYGEISVTDNLQSLHNRRQLLDPCLFSPVDTRHHLFRLLTTVFNVPMTISAKMVCVINRVLNEALETMTDLMAPIGIEVQLLRTMDAWLVDDDYDEDEWIQRIIEQLSGADGNKVNFVPASKSAIDKLERFRYEGCGENCVVCLTEFEKGIDVIKTPCSHLYHDDCIVNWLSTSHVCPICRFELPTDSTDMEIC